MDTRNEAIEHLHTALASHFPIKDAQVLMSRRGLPLEDDEALVILSPAAMHVIASLLEDYFYSYNSSDHMIDSKNNEMTGKAN